MDAIGFDIRGVELTHHGADCSFETFLKRYELDDESLQAIARIVHGADLGDERYHAPEAAGVDVLIRGSLAHARRRGAAPGDASLFDGLYEYCRLAADCTTLPR